MTPKMKLFERKIQEHGQKLYRKGLGRFQTQPVTPENTIEDSRSEPVVDSEVEEVRAAVVSLKNSQPTTNTESFGHRKIPPAVEEGTGKSAGADTSTLERVRAKKVVHLHTNENGSGLAKEISVTPTQELVGATGPDTRVSQETTVVKESEDRQQESGESLEKRRRARQEKRADGQKQKDQLEGAEVSTSSQLGDNFGSSETPAPHQPTARKQQVKLRSFGVVGRSKTTGSVSLHTEQPGIHTGGTGQDTTEMIETEGRPSIGERLAALKSTEEDWRRRVVGEKKCTRPESEVILRSRSGAGNDDERPIRITERMSQLLTSQERWQQRVTEKDTTALTVSGKLEKAGIKIVQPSQSTPTAAAVKQPSPPRSVEMSVDEKPPEKPIRMTKLAKAMAEKDGVKDANVRLSLLPQLDEGLDDFYKPTKSGENSPEGDSPKIDSAALDAVTAADSTPKLVISKGVKPPKRKAASTPRNPIKHLARSDLVQKGYQEKVAKTPLVQFRRGGSTEQQPTGSSQGDLTPKRPYSAVMDPLLKPGNRGTQLANEALRALAAKEDFGAVKLRKADPSRTPGQATENRPYKDLMLIQVKGKKHVQLRLVEPSWKSLNSGDCFILITPDNVFLYEGRFANLLEKAKAKEVANYVVETKDMGCLGASRVIDMNEEQLLAVEESDERLSPSQDRFWSLLGGGCAKDVRVPKDLEEDRVFEESLAVASLAYRVVSPNDDSVYKLQLSEEYSGEFLEHKMLNEDEVWVLDFGCELYVWNGKSVSGEQRKAGLRLARELLWEKQFDVAVVGVDPFVTFDPTSDSFPKDAPSFPKSRPEWCLFGQVKEKMETFLFRGKFVDWPEMRKPLDTKGLFQKFWDLL